MPCHSVVVSSTICMCTTEKWLSNAQNFFQVKSRRRSVNQACSMALPAESTRVKTQDCGWCTLLGDFCWKQPRNCDNLWNGCSWATLPSTPPQPQPPQPHAHHLQALPRFLCFHAYTLSLSLCTLNPSCPPPTPCTYTFRQQRMNR